jgi:hypothetical protein
MAFAFSVPGGTSNPAIAVDSGGNAFVSYLHFDTTMNAYVAKWNVSGSVWLPQGGAINPVAGQNCKKGQNVEYRNWIALDRTNSPSVAILESDGTHDNVYVERLNGAAWQPVGAAVNAVSGQDTSAPSLVIDRSSGTPFVGFYELDAVNGILEDVFVARFNGTNWATIAGPINPAEGYGLNTGGGGSAGLALDAMGRPIIDFISTDLNIYVVAIND